MKTPNKIVHILSSIILVGLMSFLFVSATHATNYTYELSNEQTWTNESTTTSSTQYVTARKYVAGSKSLNYFSVPVHSSKTTNTNSLGDRIEYIANIYGPSYSRVDPFDGPLRNVKYGNLYGTTHLIDINDQRLSLGIIGSSSFIYDIVYDQFTPISAIDTEWTNASDLNNIGQITGSAINDGGSTRKGFVYDCLNGQQTIDVPTSNWTTPHKIDDQGNVYGWFSSAEVSENYFIARPDTPTTTIDCSLVARDDVANPIVFEGGTTFEMSGDMARGIKIADFDGGGVNDLLINHEVGKTILYLGEENFDSKIKYYGDEFNTLAEGIEFPTTWDLNNDGIDDKVVKEYSRTKIYFGKADGTYYYVPQELNYSNVQFADFNNDGLLDIAYASGAFASIVYQKAAVEPTPTEPTPVDPTPTEPVPVDSAPIEPVLVDPAPIEPEPTPTEPVLWTPGIKNAVEVEDIGVIKKLVDNKIVLTDGRKLWYGDDTIVKYNEQSEFLKGQDLEFKAWKKPNGVMVGIKIEIVE